jgi:hypothetical protein
MNLYFYKNADFIINATDDHPMIAYCLGLAIKSLRHAQCPSVVMRRNFGWHYTFNGKEYWASRAAEEWNVPPGGRLTHRVSRVVDLPTDSPIFDNVELVKEIMLIANKPTYDQRLVYGGIARNLALCGYLGDDYYRMTMGNQISMMHFSYYMYNYVIFTGNTLRGVSANALQDDPYVDVVKIIIQCEKHEIDSNEAKRQIHAIEEKVTRNEKYCPHPVRGKTSIMGIVMKSFIILQQGMYVGTIYKIYGRSICPAKWFKWIKDCILHNLDVAVSIILKDRIFDVRQFSQYAIYCPQDRGHIVNKIARVRKRGIKPLRIYALKNDNLEYLQNAYNYQGKIESEMVDVDYIRAARYEAKSCFRWLYEKYGDSLKYHAQRIVFRRAVINDRVDILKTLVYEMNYIPLGGDFIRLCMQNNSNLEIIEMLVGLNYESYPSLVLAVKRDDFKAFRTLLPHHKLWYECKATYLAIKFKRREMCREILDNMDQLDTTPCYRREYVEKMKKIAGW